MRRVDLKKYLLLGICLVFLLAIANPAAAHSLWIETPVSVELGEDIDLQVFWGHIEYDLSELTTTDTRAYVQSPDGIVTPLSLTDEETHLKETLPTNVGGDYQFYAYRPASVYQSTLNQFTAKSLVDVQDAEEITGWDKPVGLPLEIVPQDSTHHLHAGDEFTVQILYRGAPLVNTTLNVVNEENPQGFESKPTDENGLVTVSLLDGKMLLEARHELDISGSWNGDDFEQIRHIHTLFLETHSH